MREQTAEVSAPIEQEFLSVIREYERVIYKVCYLYANPNAPLNVRFPPGFTVLPSTPESASIVKKRMCRK